MALNLPHLQRNMPIVKDTLPSESFQIWWQKIAQSLVSTINDQQETIDRLRRLMSHTVPTTILKATENGVNVTIEVLNHTRVYGDATTISITGNATDGLGLLPATWYGCYYDDSTLAVTHPTFVFTTTLSDVAPAVAAGRHSCGLILTPGLGSGDVIESGGTYPGGSASIGGELV